MVVPNEIFESWFERIRGVVPAKLQRVKSVAQLHFDSSLKPEMNQEMLHELISSSIEAGVEHFWDSLTSDERVHICFPDVKLGEVVQLPERGAGTVIRTELTKRFGLEVTYQLASGQLFKW